ncbi:MAG: hypothetical protein HW421_1924 [Ignavibacteria bacterium]|nr:hypothetical protein [Ignavibacteria bacterium]
MTENKTRPTEQSVDAFLANVLPEKKRKDAIIINQIIKEFTGVEPKMWGESIIGFGQYHYKYESGREGDSCIIGFSPRKQNITVYLSKAMEKYNDIMSRLGKHKHKGSCLHINKVEDINLNVFKELLEVLYKGKEF